MEDRSIFEREMRQIQEIRDLDLEELQVEEVEESSSDDDDATVPAGQSNVATMPDELTFNTTLASLHTYLGEVEDTHHRLSFLDVGAVHLLPLFYLEGVVLFPEATLPLRVIQPSFIAAIERALTQADRDAPLKIGVVRLFRGPANPRFRFSTTGTTAEIRQFRRLEDGSLNAVTRGQQRFHLKRCWIDAEGVPCGEVQIIHEDLPLRTPDDAFGKLPSSSYLGINSGTHPSEYPHVKLLASAGEDDGSDDHSEESFESALSLPERTLHHSLIGACYESDSKDGSTCSDDDELQCDSEINMDMLDHDGIASSVELKSKFVNASCHSERNLTSARQSCSSSFSLSQRRPADRHHGVSKAFWPYWVYRMYDSYSLAQRVAEMWKRIVGAPAMDDLLTKPDILSFQIASKIPVSEATRQELLDIDGVSYRLRREIEILECFDRIRCKICQTIIARRSDMLVMSADGPLAAYVNPYGCVHEIMTLCRTSGIALTGRPVTEYSWFPGYAWTIANCGACNTQMGWLFTATNKKLKPKLFWGIRSSQVADDLS
ncbi:hypothetical protein MLD38_006367 [Melastoma candidum]|uniref:Uncharacterized protein n=1 Tax=Melastoma candidum TaxID=119954 RepID=A0ACB9RM95_9MYRT|nr:hypothetical protein MLD38_006367 [Melastoma candidum]